MGCHEEESYEINFSSGASLTEDSIQAQILSDSAFKVGNSNPGLRIKLDSMALVHSLESEYHRYTAYSLAGMGNSYKYLERYSESERLLRQSLQVRIRYLEPSDVASGHNLLGLMFKQSQRLDSAISHFEKGREITQEAPLLRSLDAKLLDGLVMAYRQKGIPDRALDLLAKELMIIQTWEKEGDLAKAYQNMGVMYQSLGKLATAEDFYIRAGKIFGEIGDREGKLDAQINLGALMLEAGDWKRAEPLLENSLNQSRQWRLSENEEILLYNLGVLEQQMGNLKRAKSYFKSGWEKSRKLKKTQNSVDFGLALVELNLKTRDLDACGPIFRELSNFPNEMIPPTTRENLLEQQVAYWQMKQDYSQALSMQSRLLELQQKEREKLQAATLLSDQLQFEQRRREKAEEEAKIQRLQLEQQIADARLIRLYAILGFVVSLCLLLVFLVRRRQLRLRIQLLQTEKKAELEKNNRLEKDKEIKKVLQEAEVKTLEVQMEAQERERKRIAKDLHDRLGSKLAMTQIMIEGLLSRTSINGEEQRQAIHLLEDSCEELRIISRNLHSSELSKLGLEVSLRKLCQHIDKSGKLTFKFVSYNVPSEVSMEFQQEILAVARTLIENVLRHAEASEATLQVIRRDNILNISLEDNGVGFDLNAQSQFVGMGLRNTEERINRLEGTLSIESAPNRGTFISIDIPLQFE